MTPHKPHRPGPAMVWAACFVVAFGFITGCQFLPGDSLSDDTIEVGVLPDDAAAAAALDPITAEGAPDSASDGPTPDPAVQTSEAPQDTAPADAPTEPAMPDPVAPFFAAEQAACLARGGMYQRVGQSDVRACVFATNDAGRTCTTGAACEGLCLARSGTCAPVTPLYGCHEIFQNNGLRTTQCLQ